MFNKSKYEDRLASWQDFRKTLETSASPLEDAVNFYNQAPTVNMHTDPWDNTMWPSPWELVNENQYCDFCKLLGICYSLQLTERLNQKTFEIHIGIDRTNTETYYLLFVDNQVIGYGDAIISREKLPSTIISQKTYTMPELH